MATAVAPWPSTINVTNFSDYGETWDTNFAEFAPDVGPAKRRRRMSLSSDTLSPVMYLTSAEVETFRTFYRTTIKDGTLPFTFPSPRTGIIEQYTFKGSAPQIKFADYGLYQVSMTWCSVPNTRASWLPLLTVSGALIPSIAPDSFADFATEGSTDPHYWYSGNRYASFATWLAAMGGTYSRAGAARYAKSGVLQTVAAVNIPRFPTDASGVATGLRLTGAGTNQLLRSNTLNVSPWGGASFVSAGVAGPDGISNSSWLIVSGNPGVGGISQGITSGITGSPQTLSFFVKQATSSTLNISAFDLTSSAHIYLPLITWTAGVPVVTTGAGTGTTKTRQLANGWWRIEMTFTGTATHNFLLIVYPESSGGGTGLGNYFYGFQLDNAAFATDYVTTTTATVTQAADVLSFPFTQTAFSAFVSCINQNDDLAGTGQRLFGLSTYAPLYLVSGTGATFNGTSALTRTLNSYANLNKLMVAGNGSGRSLIANGGVAVSDANVLVGATPTTGWLGSDAGTSHFSYGDMRQFALWNGNVASAADLVRLTT